MKDTDVPLNDDLTKLVRFDDKRADVMLLMPGAGDTVYTFSLNAAEAWSLLQLLTQHLYIHKEVRVLKDAPEEPMW